jgi:predicted dehydrogenase
MHAIASRSKDRARKAAQQLNIPVWYGSYEELLQDKEIEAVFIPLPNHMHTEWVKKAADAGKHILCEKPLALNADDARDAIEYARKKKVMVMEAFMYRFHSQWKRVKELVSVGEIGELHAIHSFFSYNLTDPENIRNNPETGGGGLRDIGCYCISSARTITGREPERVISLIHRDETFETDTLTSGLLDFGGVRALFTVGTRSFPYQRVDIHGSNGVISIHVPFNMYPDVPAEVTVTTGIGTRELLLGPEDQYGLQFEAFSSALRAGEPEPTPPEDAVNNQKVIDALFRSQQTNEWEMV